MYLPFPLPGPPKIQMTGIFEFFKIWSLPSWKCYIILIFGFDNLKIFHTFSFEMLKVVTKAGCNNASAIWILFCFFLKSQHCKNKLDIFCSLCNEFMMDFWRKGLAWSIFLQVVQIGMKTEYYFWSCQAILLYSLYLSNNQSCKEITKYECPIQ